jgi:hypothetical protein
MDNTASLKYHHIPAWIACHRQTLLGYQNSPCWKFSSSTIPLLYLFTPRTNLSHVQKDANQSRTGAVSGLPHLHPTLSTTSSHSRYQAKCDNFVISLIMASPFLPYTLPMLSSYLLSWGVDHHAMKLTNMSNPCVGLITMGLIPRLEVSEICRLGTYSFVIAVDSPAEGHSYIGRSSNSFPSLACKWRRWVFSWTYNKSTPL